MSGVAESKMDAFRRAVRKSPTVAKDQGKYKHSKMPEGWGENKEAVVDGITFYLKYIGSTLVEEVDSDETYGDGISAKAIHSIISMAKSAGKKLRKTALTVSPKGIRTVDMTTNQVMFDISIYRVSFCTADKGHDHVFAYIARNTTNETMECHAFLCAKEKIAQAVTLTVSQAFSVAQDKWLENKLQKKAVRGDASRDKSKTSSNNPSSTERKSSSPIISFTSSPTPPPTPEILTDSLSQKMTFCTASRKNWQSFDETEDNIDDNIDDLFSRLAENRCKISFNTDLKVEELDGVQKYMAGSACYEAFSRTISMDDLLSL
ncbi:Low density lipoprotein receptor adapter protein 1-A [Bulinus truncatus]|nr:Low density lipoprotein receptor adapter protein 1-A [Bulinus truncatus]